MSTTQRQPIKKRPAVAAYSVWFHADLVNPLNTREHWAKRSSRAKDQRSAAYYSLRKTICQFTAPLVIRLTRFYGGRAKEMDGDGLQAAFKPIRDGVADWLNLDDAEKNGLTWICNQVKAEDKSLIGAVRIHIAKGKK